MAEQHPAIATPAGQEFLASALGHLRNGDLDLAMAEAEAAIIAPETRADALAVLAAVAFRTNQIASAIQLLHQCLDEGAAQSDLPEILAVLSCLSGQITEALYFAKLSTVIKTDNRHLPLFGPGLPGFADAFRSMGEKPLVTAARQYLAAGLPDRAIASIEQHLQLIPNDVEALDCYGEAAMAMGEEHQAVSIIRTAMTLGGPSATLLSRLGQALTRLGEHDSAMGCHREAVKRAPSALPLRLAEIRDWDYHPWHGNAARAAAIAGWQDAAAQASGRKSRRHAAAMVKPMLTVGILCAAAQDDDTRAMITVLARAFDRSGVTVVGFGNGELSLPTNIVFRDAFDRWRNVSRVDDLTLAALVRGEGVDVLLDADGLLSPQSTVLFSRNCAPVQVSWLNMPADIPLDENTVRFGDLPGLTVGPLLLSGGTDPISRDQEETAGPRFGADVTLAELNAEVIRVWAGVLHAVPNATLLLLDHKFSVPSATAKLIEGFGNLGVAHRIDVVTGTAAEFWGHVDVALAPFPVARPASYAAALASGIPVVALNQGRATQLAQSIKATGPQGERMIAADLAQYEAIAVAWGTDGAARARLAALGAEEIRASAMFQPVQYAAAVEAAFRQAVEQKVQG